MNDWYYQTTTATHGPFSPDEMKGKAASGEVRPDTLVRKGDKEWSRADKFGFLGFRTEAGRTPQAEIPSVIASVLTHWYAQTFPIKAIILCCPLALLLVCVLNPELIAHVGIAVVLISLSVYGAIKFIGKSNQQRTSRILDICYLSSIFGIVALFVADQLMRETNQRVQSLAKETERYQQDRRRSRQEREQLKQDLEPHVRNLASLALTAKKLVEDVAREYGNDIIPPSLTVDEILLGRKHFDQLKHIQQQTRTLTHITAFQLALSGIQSGETQLGSV